MTILEDYKTLLNSNGELDYKSDGGMEYKEMYDDFYIEWLQKLCKKYNIEFNKNEIDWEWCNYIQNKQYELEKTLEKKLLISDINKIKIGDNMKILEEKNKLIEQLDETRKNFIKADIKYRRKKCRIMLECNFEEILQKSRPTVAEKEAYVEFKTLNLKEKKELLYSKIKKLELEISLCDNKLEVELQ